MMDMTNYYTISTNLHLIKIPILIDDNINYMFTVQIVVLRVNVIICLKNTLDGYAVIITQKVQF